LFETAAVIAPRAEAASAAVWGPFGQDGGLAARALGPSGRVSALSTLKGHGLLLVVDQEGASVVLGVLSPQAPERATGVERKRLNREHKKARRGFPPGRKSPVSISRII
jgi:hypothetical protein